MRIKTKMFYLSAASFALGIILRSFFDIGFYSSVFLLLLSAGVFAYCLFLKIRQEEVRRIFVFAVVFLCFTAGIFRFEISDWGREKAYEKNMPTGDVCISGLVDDEPDEKDTSLGLTVSVEKAALCSGETFDLKGRVYVYADSYPKYKYGDKVNLRGKIQKPDVLKNDDGRIFDYPSYLSKDGIYFAMMKPKISLVSTGGGFFLKRKLLELKNYFSGKLEEVLPEPESSLEGGLLLGAKQSLGKKLLADFRKAGVVHIVVLSGYNITIVAEFIMSALSFLPRLLSFYFGAAGIILFALMTGAGATVVRASIMALIAILAKASGRTYEIARALVIAGLIMILENPRILAFDSSFQLSFMAAFSLIYFSQIFENKFSFLPEKFKIREIVVSTVSTQVFVFPFLLYKMGDFSTVAIFTNLLILPLIPATMLLGFLAGVTAIISQALAFPVSAAAYSLLFYELKVVEILAGLPFASFHIGAFPLWIAVLIYVFYAWLVAKNASRNPAGLPQAGGISAVSSIIAR